MDAIYNKAKSYYEKEQARVNVIYDEAEKTASYNMFLAAEYAQERILIGISDYMQRYRRNGFA